MFLLSAAWLGVLAAAAVPVVLHLISRGRYRRIRVGSIRLIPANASQRGRRFRPSQLLLLALRCALLAAVALALAGPRIWWTADGTSSGRSWILVSPEILELRDSLEPSSPVSGGIYAELDARVSAGTSLRLLAPGFPPAGSVQEAHRGRLDDWSLLLEADRVAPPDVAFHVVTLDRLAALRGERPALGRRIRWQVIRSGEENRWIQRAASTPAPVLVGASDRERTIFRRGEDELQVRDDGAVSLVDGGLLATDDVTSVALELPPISAVILHDQDRAEDAAYVAAGLAAAAEFASVPLEVRLPGNLEDLGAPGNVDLIFHLAAAPMPEALRTHLENGAVLVTDGLDRHETSDTVAVTEGPATFAVHRRSAPDPGEGESAVVWPDALGRPVLDVARVGEGLWYRLHGRIHPLWSELPLHPALPEWLSSLVESRARDGRIRSAALPRSDLRQAHPSQRQPVVLAGSRSSRRADAAPERWLWLLVLALLGIERSVSARGEAS